jgi:hypothetical protein
MYYVPNLHDFHAFFTKNWYKPFYPCETCEMQLLSVALQVQDAYDYMVAS